MVQITAGIIFTASSNRDKGFLVQKQLLSVAETSEEVCCIKAKDVRDTCFKITIL